jgi:hypothetical protein
LTDFYRPPPDLPLGLPRKDRQDTLRQWSFNCTCNFCNRPRHLDTASDMRRVRLHEIAQALMNYDELRRDTVDDLARELNVVVQAEGVPLMFCEYYMAVARAYMVVHAFPEAREHVRLAEEYWVRYGTEEHENVEGVRELKAELARQEQIYNQGPHPRWWYEDDDDEDDEEDARDVGKKNKHDEI